MYGDVTGFGRRSRAQTNSDRISILIIKVVHLGLSSMPIGGLLYNLKFVRLEGSAIHNAVYHLGCFVLCTLE